MMEQQTILFIESLPMTQTIDILDGNSQKLDLIVTEDVSHIVGNLYIKMMKSHKIAL